MRKIHDRIVSDEVDKAWIEPVMKEVEEAEEKDRWWIGLGILRVSDDLQNNEKKKINK